MASKEPNADQEKPPFKCFLHSVSPVKKSGSCRYFNCDLQTQTGVTRAVCFDVDKRATFETLAEQKSPVQIKKYTLSNKFGREDVQISKHTDIIPLTGGEKDLTFEYQQEESVMTIASLVRVTPGQLIDVKGKVVHLTASKILAFQSGPLKKQECCIVDPSGHIKVTLWEKYTNEVELNKTYQFNKFRIRKDGQDILLNTPKDEDRCVINEIEPFQEPLPTVDAINLTEVKEITATVIGVHTVTRNIVCYACKKTVKIAPNGKFAHCINEHCNMTQKAAKCPSHWSLKLVVQDQVNPAEQYHLMVYHLMTKKLLSFTENKIDINAVTSEQEILEELLSIDTLKVSFDPDNKKLLNAELS